MDRVRAIWGLGLLGLRVGVQFTGATERGFVGRDVAEI
jgi:hypothetical protein